MRTLKVAIAAAPTLAMMTALAAIGPALSAQAKMPAGGKTQAVHTASAPVLHTAGADDTPAKIIAYWTPKAMEAAAADPLPSGTANISGPKDGSGKPMSAPGGGAPTDAQLANALANLPGPHSRVWRGHHTLPATSIGRLFFRTNHGRNSSCSAAVIAAPNRETIWTAGHCVSDGHRHWYSKFLFIPDLNGDNHPLGVWTYKDVATPNAFFFLDAGVFDLAALALNKRNGLRIGNVTGWQGYKFGEGYVWNAYMFGYPANLKPGHVHVDPKQLRYCTGKTFRTGLILHRQGVRCDMGNGSSGGPWLSDLKIVRGWGYLVGNVSANIGADFMESPHFGRSAENVYNSIKNN